MNGLMNISGKEISSFTGGVGGITQELLSSIPLALSAPILAYQRTKAQEKLLEVLVEAKRLERAEILKTIRVLSANGKLTDELARQLMIAYNATPY